MAGRRWETKDARRAENDVRVKEFQNLTPEAQLASLPKDGARKQRAKILRRLGRAEDVNLPDIPYRGPKGMD